MRVLVVEDTARMGELIRRGLKEQGYAVDLAGTGEDGVWLASENPYDVVRAGRDAARHRRLRGVPAVARGRPVEPGADAHRQGVGRRPGDRPRRRAPTTTSPNLRLRGVARARPGAGSTRSRGAAGGPAGRATSASIRRPIASPGGEPSRADGEGVLAARAVHAASGRGPQSPLVARARVGLRLRRWVQCGGRLHPIPSREDRPAVPTHQPRDRARSRLPAPEIRAAAMAARLPLRWRLTLAFAAGMALVLVALGLFLQVAAASRPHGVDRRGPVGPSAVRGRRGRPWRAARRRAARSSMPTMPCAGHRCDGSRDRVGLAARRRALAESAGDRIDRRRGVGRSRRGRRASVNGCASWRSRVGTARSS